MASGSARGRFAEVLAELTDGIGPAADVDEGADLMVRRERGRSGAEVRDALAGERRRPAGRTGRRRPEHQGRVGRRASCRPARWRRHAWPRRGSTPATSPTVSASPSPPATACAGGPAGVAHPSVRLRPCRPSSCPARSGSTFEDRRAKPGTSSPTRRPVTTIRGDGVELCLVAARRLAAAETGLAGEGPDAAAVLDLVRTYA